MTTAETREADVLEDVFARYEAEGFDVFINPTRSILPQFMQEYRPDAVAMKPEKKIAIELTRSDQGSATKVNRLRELFSDHPEWELAVYHVAPRSTQSAIEVASIASIDSAIEEATALKDAGRLRPALLMAWAALEAVGRALLPDEFARRQPPSRLLETLASEGLLTPSEADSLREVVSLRNAAAHGQLNVAIAPKQLDDLIGAVRTLAGFLKEAPGGQPET
jgi:uncharacterized protein YutE (UPF0331/DUF86 family)